MPRKRKDKRNMVAVIERIVIAERSDADAFIKIQQKRLQQLQRIQKKDQGIKTSERNKVILELKASGILDANGNLAKQYSDDN